MAIGDITTIAGDLKRIELLANATAANSPPSGASAGLSTNDIQAGAAFGRIPQVCELLVDNSGTTESGVLDVLLRLWCYFDTTIGWVPYDNGHGGFLNRGMKITEVAADTLKHRERIFGLDRCARVYVEIVNIGGTNTGVTCYLVDRLPYGQAETLLPNNPLGMLVPISTDSKYLGVTTASQDIITTMEPGERYVFTSTVDCYIEQGAAPTAAASDGSFLVPAGMPVVIDGAEGAELAVLGLVAGVATLTRMKLL